MNTSYTTVGITTHENLAGLPLQVITKNLSIFKPLSQHTNKLLLKLHTHTCSIT